MTTPISIDGKSFEFCDAEIKEMKTGANFVYTDALPSVGHERAQVESLKHFIRQIHAKAGNKLPNDSKNPIRKS